MHALILLQSNRLTVLIFREYSELLFDQLTTNKSVTRGTVKILLFKHACSTCRCVTCCWTLTSSVPWPEASYNLVLILQLQRFSYSNDSVDCSWSVLNWFLILFMYLFITTQHLHCLDIIAFPRSISYGAVIHRFCLHINQIAIIVSAQFIDSQLTETYSSQ